MSDSPPIPSYSEIACVGSGLSAIALGATLQRWHQINDVVFFERESDSGGTWNVNSYPGAACDVPSVLYSFSFAQNPGWTKLLPSRQEIKRYHDEVVNDYGLRSRMVFRADVRESIWRADARRWILTISDLETGHYFTHECKILFAATGQLSNPRACDIPGAPSFRGDIFHLARWNYNVDLTGKNVVLVGNGCTAAQIVPAIVEQTKTLTQIIRSPQWILPSVDFTYSPFLQWIFRNIPLALRVHRLQIFAIAETDVRLVRMTKRAAKLRAARREVAERYMRDTAPEKYHDILIPDFEYGCKRRIYDCGYLESLGKENLTLSNSRITEIAPEGVKTVDRTVPADVIILCTGFQTDKSFPGFTVRGRNGLTVDEHWERQGGAGAYNCSALHGFPNFFILLGPNSLTGHTSALMAVENSINYALRVLNPVLAGEADSVEVKPEAEECYIENMQNTLKRRIWNAGCTSWYVNGNGRNSAIYPWSSWHYWYRSLFPTRSNWTIDVGKATAVARALRRRNRYLRSLVIVIITIAFVRPEYLARSLYMAQAYLKGPTRWLA